MEIIPQTDLKKLSFPLPIYQTIEIGEAISRDGEHFYIFVGLNKEMVIQLKTLSLDGNDIDLQKNTVDKNRFGKGSYEDWYRKNRTPFVLVHKNTNALAALVWFGPDSLPEHEGNWHTSAWRSYIPFRGKGLIKEFLAFSINTYFKNAPHVKLWARIKSENITSEKLVEGLGFKLLEKLSNNNSHYLVLVNNLELV
ncbi:MAG: GNAT family N-acetyltransferase [Candidatus Paceibacterota bacterium]